MTQPTELNTLEVRWFGDGAVPDGLLNWLDAQGSVDCAHRSDLYFGGGTSGRNLKLRGGDSPRIELKWRLGATPWSFTDDLAGTAEQWYKWSFRLAEPATLWEEDTTDLWILVDKIRRLCTRPVTVGDTDVTAQLEVTQLQVRGSSAWTCGLEVDGPPSVLVDALERAGDRFFDARFPRPLTEKTSQGYVAWLEKTIDVRPSSTVTAEHSER